MTDFKNVKCELLRQHLNSAPWSICGIFDDIVYVAMAWECLYKGILNDHLKTTKVKVPTNGLKWMNSTIRKEMNRGYALLKKAQSKPNNSDLWKQYRRQRNHGTKLMREAEALFWKD